MTRRLKDKNEYILLADENPFLKSTANEKAFKSLKKVLSSKKTECWNFKLFLSGSKIHWNDNTRSMSCWLITFLWCNILIEKNYENNELKNIRKHIRKRFENLQTFKKLVFCSNFN